MSDATDLWEKIKGQQKKTETLEDIEKTEEKKQPQPEKEKSEPTTAKPETEETEPKEQEIEETTETKVAEEPQTKETKKEPEVVQPPVQNIGEFDLSPAKEGEGHHKMIYGDKGSGKTVLAFSEKGKIACLSFDLQSQIIAKDFPPFKEKNITVFDAVRYYSELDPEMKLESSERSLRYINALLDGPIKKLQPDWIVLDGTEIFTHICEMTMRARNNLQPFEGIRNLNVWKERNMYMNTIHRKASQVAKKGVIYTAYVRINTITTAQGETKREQPKWAGDIQYKTRVVIKVEAETMQDSRIFYATVESSKVTEIPTSGRKIVGTVGNDGEIDFKGLEPLKR